MDRSVTDEEKGLLIRLALAGFGKTLVKCRRCGDWSTEEQWDELCGFHWDLRYVVDRWETAARRNAADGL